MPRPKSQKLETLSDLVDILKSKTTPEVMNLVEFMEYTRLGYKTALEVLNEIPHKHIGREWRIHKKAVDDWLLNKTA
jgi:hypothetical protein